MMDASPLRGLERISSELSQERAKCTAALKDRARQKIEIEKLKQKNQAYQEELVELRDRLEESEKHIENESNELNQSTFKLNDKDREISQCKSELQSAVSQIENYKKELEALQSSHAQLNERYVEIRNEYEDENDAKAMLEKQVQELQESNQALRSQKNRTDDTVSSMSAKYSDQLKELEEYKLRSRKYDTISEKYNWLMQSSDEIRRELEETLRRNTDLSHQCREAQDLAAAREDEVHRYQDELEEANAQIQLLQDENSDILAVHKELNLQIESHKKNLEAEASRSEDARVNRQYLDAHINELRDAHSSALQQVASAESELAAASVKISALTTEVTQLRDQAQLVEVAQKEAEYAHNLSLEVETLRGELTSVRKQLVKREVEEEANTAISESSGGFSGRVMSEREANSRKVYEGIIEDLRSSLDKAINEQYNLTNQLEVAKKKTIRVEQLEDEIAMYRDTVKLVAVENQSAVVSISESLERTQKLEHENQNLVRSARNAENECRLNQADIKRLKEELQEEKKKHRGVHVDKLSIERRVAELSAEKSRMESVQVDLSRDVEQKEYDLKRADRIIDELRDELNSCKQQLASTQVDGDLSSKKFNDMNTQLNLHKQRLMDAEAEVRALRETRATLQREIDMLNEVTATHRRSAAECSLQMDNLRREIQELQNTNDVNRKTISQRGNENAEQQIQMLRSDLSKTVIDWKEAERERQIKEDTSKRLQTELMKERDKSQLLLSQVSKLEERLLTANRELATFRGLDVYHAAKEAELATYRSTKLMSQSHTAPDASRRVTESPKFARPTAQHNDNNDAARGAIENVQSNKPKHGELHLDRQYSRQGSITEGAVITDHVPSITPPNIRSDSFIGEPLNIDDISASASSISRKDVSGSGAHRLALQSQRSYLDEDTEESDTDQRTDDRSRYTRNAAKTPKKNDDANLKTISIEHTFSDSGEDDVQAVPSRLVRETAGRREAAPDRRQDRFVTEDMDTRGHQTHTPRATAGQTKASENFADHHSRTARDSKGPRGNKNSHRESVDAGNHFSFSSSTPPLAAYSSSQRTPSAGNRPVERVRPHRDITYNPSKADFEKARKLLARSGNYSSSKK